MHNNFIYLKLQQINRRDIKKIIYLNFFISINLLIIFVYIKLILIKRNETRLIKRN